MPPKKSTSAKKRAKALRQKRYRDKVAQKIDIGDEFSRWNSVKTSLSAENDSEMAKILLDSYLDSRTSQTIGEMRINTPVSKFQKLMSTPMPGRSTDRLPVPEASSVSEGSESAAGYREDTVYAGPSSRKRFGSREASQKFYRFARLTTSSQEETPKKKTRVEIDISNSDTEDMYDPDYDPDDPTYQADEFNISIVQSDNDDDDSLDEYGITEDVFDIDVEADVVMDQPTKDAESVPRLSNVTNETVTEKKYIVTEECLCLLLDMIPFNTCHICQKPVGKVLRAVGCVIECKWTCGEKDHFTHKWTSSPMLPNGVYLCNFQALTSILLSGNNFTKVAMFARFLCLAFPAHSTFTRLQSHCMVPVVSRFWENVKQSTLEEHRTSDLIISGDGRMDSPGHSAKYCTYTIMNQADKAILALEVVDKREVGLKSVVMEAQAFQRAMASIQREGVGIKEVVTDAHPQISKIMRVSFANVKHSYDMWHGAKNLGKKISKVACMKGNEVLKPWVKEITNHFFHCAETCDGNVDIMKMKWLSVLNHVTDKHVWILGQCDHGPLDEDERHDKRWIAPNSHVYNDLNKQVSDTRLLRTFPYYVTCQTTSELESFNNHLLMYAPKRNAFSYSVYKCRCQLAALDYTMHLKRQQLMDKDGKPRCSRAFSKAANNWSVRPIKERKTYCYIPELMVDICNYYCTGGVSLRKINPIPEGHPKLIAATIAPKTPPPTAELQEKQVSRLKQRSVTSNI